MATESSRVESDTHSNDWTAFREQMPVAQNWSYFDHAAVAPIPKVAFEQINKWAIEAVEEGDAVWPSWNRLHENCRKSAANLINSEVSEIALVPNTTFGINLVADGLDWNEGDNVVLPENEFPSNLYPWMSLQARGVEVRQVPLDGHKVCVNRLADAIDARTRVVSVSWVGYASGYRVDAKEVSEMVHEKGSLFFLDAIQGLGVFPLDVKDANIDFLAADGHKWLLGPEGAGIFYLKYEHLDRLRPMNIGWNSVAQGNDYTNVKLDVRKAASRYEGGTQNMAGFIGLGASLDLLQQFGLSPTDTTLGRHVVEVTDRMVQALSDAGVIVHSERAPDISSGIVLFEVPGKEPAEIRKALLENKVITSCRGGHVRAAAHCYNNDSDIDRMVETIKHVM